MNKFVSIAAIVATVAFAGSANALTLKKGEVLSGGEVVKASETPTGQAKLANDGVYVAGGMVYIDLNGSTLEVPMADLQGKSRDRMKEIIGDAAGDQLADLVSAVDDHVAELGENAISAIGKSAEELVSKAIEENIDTFVGVSDELHEQMLDQFEKIDGTRPQPNMPRR